MKKVLICGFHVLFQPPHSAVSLADNVPTEFFLDFSPGLNAAELWLFLACLGNASALLPCNLAPLLPYAHFSLSDVLRFQPSWLPVMLARFPAYTYSGVLDKNKLLTCYTQAFWL